jgi:hypothetical protein
VALRTKIRERYYIQVSVVVNRDIFDLRPRERFIFVNFVIHNLMIL